MKAETIAVTRVCFPVLALAAAGMLLATSVAMAEPLVTGDLSVYYDFDDPFTTKVFDQSNNGVYAIDANVHRDVLYYTADTVRGAGAAHFDPFLHFGAPGDPNNFNEWLNLKGPTVKALAPELMPSDGFTLSVWVNLEDYDDLGDPDVDHRHNIWDTQAAGGGTGAITSKRYSMKTYWKPGRSALDSAVNRESSKTLFRMTNRTICHSANNGQRTSGSTTL